MKYKNNLYRFSTKCNLWQQFYLPVFDYKKYTVLNPLAPQPIKPNDILIFIEPHLNKCSVYFHFNSGLFYLIQDKNLTKL